MSSGCNAHWKLLQNELKSSSVEPIPKTNKNGTHKNQHTDARKKNRKRKLVKLNESSGTKDISKENTEPFMKKNCKDINYNLKTTKPKIVSDVWFDDISYEDILEVDNNCDQIVNIASEKKQLSESAKVAKKLVKSNAYEGLTKAVAMDCEMVGVGEGGRESVLARISIVNHFGKCIYDKYVKPKEKVTDYRTFVSGIRPSDLVNAEAFEVVQKEVSFILDGRILVGHALWNDLKVLFIDHPKKCIRDTARYKPFRNVVGGRSPALRVLCSKLLDVQVQKGEHSSVQDAQATMRLYTMVKKQWEAESKPLSKNQKKKRKSEAFIKSTLEQSKT